MYCGCVPIAPNELVYPEIYPDEYLYNTQKQLVKILRNWCKNLPLFHKHRKKFFDNFSFEKYSLDYLLPKYMEKFD